MEPQTKQSVNLGLFNVAWRIGREQLRLQAPTLGVLYHAANLASSSIPRDFPFQLDEMTSEDEPAFREWVERDTSTRGATEAFATGIVLFVDNLLKGVLRFYKRLDDVPKQFRSGLNGISTDDIFRYTGNNVRHFDEWRVPTKDIPQAKQAYDAVKAIATVVGRPIPDEDILSVMAVNWSWPVIVAVSNGSFDGLLAHVRAFLDELNANAGIQDDEFVLAEIAKEN